MGLQLLYLGVYCFSVCLYIHAACRWLLGLDRARYWRSYISLLLVNLLFRVDWSSKQLAVLLQIRIVDKKKS
jgi:hypothetical protein